MNQIVTPQPQSCIRQSASVAERSQSGKVGAFSCYQVLRLQDPSVALTWLAIADAAMGICERDHAIRLLQGMATGTDEQHFIYQSQPILTKPIPTKPHRTHPSLILPTTIKPKPSQ